jgi:hypothetical protein
MLFTKFAFISALAALTAAQATTDINLDNIPAECTDTCTQVIAIMNGCNTDSSKSHAAASQDNRLTTTQTTTTPLASSASAPPTVPTL